MLKKLARWIGYIALIIIAAGVSLYLYSLHQENLKLSYMTSDTCVQRFLSQLCEEDDGTLYLRKVDIGNKRLSVSFLSDDPQDESFQYVYAAYWFENCEDNIKIELVMTDSGGTPFTLKCHSGPQRFLENSAPSRLYIALARSDKGNLSVDEFGFKINDNYEDADYAPLLRQLALTSSEIRASRKSRQKAKLQECEARNARAESTFNDEISKARQKMLGGQQVSHYCEKSVNGLCMEYTFTVSNSTQLPIRAIHVGYEKSDNCTRKPMWNKKIRSRIEPGSNFSGTVFSASNSLCTTIVGVDFYASFEPSSC